MSATKYSSPLNHDKGMALRLLNLSRIAVRAKSVELLSKNVLFEFDALMQPYPSFILINDPRLASPCYYQLGFASQQSAAINNLCSARLQCLQRRSDGRAGRVAEFKRREAAGLLFFPVQNEEACFGLIGVTEQAAMHSLFSSPWNTHWELFLRLLADSISGLIAQLQAERQKRYFDAYLAVSSMLAHTSNLRELFETSLYCCMEELSAEAGSIMLYEQGKNHFCFYQVEGPAQPVLTEIKFPADKGIAGAVFHAKKAEIINNVQDDGRFYKHIDCFSGFKTRNMIAVPLQAGEERIGVIEVLNKRGDDPFLQDEQLMLALVAEEIAFAIRNAKIFELAVNAYCKQRQGHNSCKGCNRPLGSWTPCVKYHPIENAVGPIMSPQAALG